MASTLDKQHFEKLAQGALERKRCAAGKTMRGVKVTERSMPTVRNIRKDAQIFETNLGY